jgi:phage/plasmid-like protein (TIGR03299 family)
MAHGMTSQDRMYSVRVAPWHMEETDSIVLDAAPETRAERMRLAGHDWTVLEEEIFQKSGEAIPGHKLLRRSDTQHILDVTAEGYGTVQNETGHELFEALSKGAVTDDGTGGTIKDGSFCYLSARLDEPITVKNDPNVSFPYVVVSWAYGWKAGSVSHAVKARSTNVRPVCWNTITWGEIAAIKAGTDFTFSHSTNVTERISKAMEVIRGTRENASKFQELANELADLAITDAQREDFVQQLIPAPASTFVISDRVMDNINEARAKVREIFDSETIPETHRNTGYGLLQAGTEYLDHLRGYRSHATYLGRTLLRDEPLKMKLVPLIRELASV